MTTPIYPLSTRPERAELRSAVKVLTPLARIKHGTAVAELQAVEAMIRDLYPRGTAEVRADGVKRRKRRKRGLIEERDCHALCRACGGPHKARSAGGVPHAWCLPCKGGGWELPLRATGKAEHDPETFYGDLYQGKGPKATRLPRGDVPEHGGVSQRRPVPPAPHVRGYLSGTGGGRFIGPPREDAALEADRWCPYYVREAGKPARVVLGCDAADLSSVLEAEAIKAARDDGLVFSGERGRRLVKKSRRDRGILTPGQQKRVRCEDRVRVYGQIQRRLDRAHTPPAPRVRVGAALETLRRMGVDVDALLAAMPAEVALDTPAVAEARRRADLPCDDFLQPHASELLVRISAGPCAGRTGHATMGFPSALTVRGDGTICRGPALRVDLEGGEFEYVHPGDLEAVPC